MNPEERHVPRYDYETELYVVEKGVPKDRGPWDWVVVASCPTEKARDAALRLLEGSC